MSLFRCLGHTKVSVQVGGFVCEYLITKISFHGEKLLAPRPTPKLEDHPLSAVRDCLFNIFAGTLNTGGCSSICNLRTRHAVVTGTHLSHGQMHVWKIQSTSTQQKMDKWTYVKRVYHIVHLLVLLFSLKLDDITDWKWMWGKKLK
jgi:hypothetical protein